MEKLIERILKISNLLSEVSGHRIANSPFGRTIAITTELVNNPDHKQDGDGQPVMVDGYLVEFDGFKEKAPTIEQALTQILTQVETHAKEQMKRYSDMLFKVAEVLK